MSRKEPIAIIGTACRFAGDCNTPADFWNLLQKPRDVSRPIPADRFSVDGFYHSESSYHGHSNVQSAYFLDQDVRQFDASFFGVKPIEANALDPQQRLLLETVYEAVEASGQPFESLRGSKTAVYVGLMCADYDTMISRDTDGIPTYHATGTARSIMSNRISYFFDWRGPSMTIDTACSSSLVAVHQAVQILRAGDAPIAVAAGTNLILGPEQFIAESKLRMLSPDGHSRMWDADANGYARGEGIAAIILKPLEAALRDGDHIESIIIETGVNQDGATTGITMPSATAQAELIRETYHKAGLDPSRPEDVCQYFEAHGTGTPAGDPIEAEAIHRAFFSQEVSSRRKEPLDQAKLFVGSAKTVIGHTEGTAGLAAIMKVSLALQHRKIPPNMWFSKLNPSITPHYNAMQIPTGLTDWPATSSGTPRRASINSFGFGGTNAHAILESYDSPSRPDSSTTADFFIPLVFSAKSKRSLLALLESYKHWLSMDVSTCLRDLAFNLLSRRSQWPVKAIFSARSTEDLVSKIEDYLRQSTASTTSHYIEPIMRNKTPKILGIFTGQGAQWAGMGRDLLLCSEFARSHIFHMDQWLSELPYKDRPSWSLQHELMKDASTSRINEAEISQPVCTAIQILLVKILNRSGLKLQAVVGHSSGELAAAYAAGYLTAKDSLYAAYYRGVHAKLGCGVGGQHGGMLAVGTTPEDARELCDLPYFKDRVTVAAHNSSSSITLSGDRDRIDQAQLVFEDENRFARLLKVERAYHSHHMIPCETSYVKSIGSLEFRKQNSRLADAPQWFSSVTGTRFTSTQFPTAAEYWKANMLQPVLFHEAVMSAGLENGPYDVVIEIGPHPALKSPVSQTLQELSNSQITYTALLKRDTNNIETLADGLGSIWQRFPEILDLTIYDKLMSSRSGYQVLQGLPSYCWDHDKQYWNEPRQSIAFRLRGPVHELLGHVTSDSSESLYRWRHILRVSEIPWLEGHKLQGQVVFPAAGYVVTALEAALTVAKDRRPSSIEVQDLEIFQALTFNENTTGVEIIFSISNVLRTHDGISATFLYEACLSKDSDRLSLIAKGSVQMSFVPPVFPLLPQRVDSETYLMEVGTEQFYSSLLEVGYEYTGPFKALSSLKRKYGYATGTVSSFAAHSDPGSGLVIHPGTLDAIIQAILLAHCYPNDGTLWSLHIPTAIKNIFLDLALIPAPTDTTTSFLFDSIATGSSSADLTGDVDLIAQDGNSTMLRVEGLRCSPLSTATAAVDRKVFSYERWINALPDCHLASSERSAGEQQYNLALALERIAFYYMGEIESTISEDTIADLDNAQKSFISYIKQVRSEAPNDRHPYVRPEWRTDTYDNIFPLLEMYGHTSDVRVLDTVGKQMSRVLRGETTILEHLMKDNMLFQYYSNGMGFSEHATYLARTVSQITDRYPHMHILEIGAGTGAATMHILRESRANFDRYVFTDISKGFFDSAQTLFKEVPRMVFKTFDIEISPTQQGFDDSSFDMIVASNVVHATKSIEQTLRNIRRLLKPGGYLAMLEITDNGPIRSGFVFGSLPGWWLGVDDGRSMSPLISPSDWDAVLRRTGFSGVDTITPQTHTLPYPGSGFISQAIDDRIEFLRQPMQSRAHNLHQSQFADQLILLGGSSVNSASFVETMILELGAFFGSVSHVKDLAEFGELNICTDAAILSIAELDGALFEGITTETFEVFKSILEPGRIIQWITRGRNDEEPYANMTVGFCRSQLLEVPGVSLQFLDFSNDEELNIDTLLRSFLQFCASVRWELDLSSRYLYSIEPEISIVHGRQEILRLVPNTDQNDRFNSSRRSIPQTLGSCDADVRLISDGNGLKLKRCPSQPPQTGDDDEEEVSVTVACASLSPIRIRSLGAFYIALGTEENSNAQLLCLSQVHGPHLRVPRLLVVPCTFAVENAPNILLRIIYNIIADTVLDSNTRGTILIQDPPSQFTMALERSSSERISNVSFISSTPKCPLGTLWKFIHPRSSQRYLERELPRNVRFYLNCSKASDSLKVSELVQQTLTGDYDHATLGAFCSQQPFFEESYLTTISHVLEGFISNLPTEGDNISGESGVNILSPRNTISVTQPSDPFSVMRWDESAGIEIPVRPVDEIPLFKGDSTYWLVGLTQSLGLSLCEWMIRKGARNVVLSSRNPHVDHRWMEKLRALGATIKISANDISDKASVQALYDEIICTMPPIAGVAHGAMVLRDCLVKDMSLVDLQSVIIPKVEGAKNLDQIFYDQQLDFFLLFSSMATVVGNVGQSNYTAANAFLTSLSAKRRKRGVAASVINIGAVLGVGYVTEQLNTTYHKKLRDGGHTWMSEQLFHQTFAEGVLASAINSTEHCQISTGLRYVTHSDSDPPFWYDNPKFSHHILQDDTTETGNDLGTMQGLPIQTQLAQASSQSQVLEILETQLLAKLRNVLQMDDQGNYTDETILQRSMSALGVDSLIAVDIRSWFMKSCNVNVPVLQILGGTSVRDLLEYAMNNLPSGVTGVDEIKIVGSSSAPESYIARQNTGPDDDSSTSPENTSPQKSQSPSICTDESPNTSEGSDLASCDDNTVSTSSVDSSPVRTAPISRTQSLFWFVNNYLDDSMSLNHSGLYRIKGSIRPIDLQSAVQTVAQRHEILRTAFVQTQQGEVMQEVMESAQLNLEMKTVESEKNVWDELLVARQYAFDPTCGRTMRMTLLTLSAKMHYLVFSCHPIILDGTSQLIFMTDLEKAYDGKCMAPVLQFINLTIEQISAEENGTWDAELKYWADEFSVLPPTLELFPFCKQRTRKPLGSYAVCRLDARINADLNFRLRRACSKLDSTPFQVHVAVLRVLLSQLSGNQHICIGTAEANRHYPPGMSAIGPYMNILPLRFDSSGYSTFATILRDTRQKVLGAMSNSRVPFELILKEVNAPRSATHSPLFQALIDYRQGTKEKQPWSDCELEFLNFDTGRHGYDVGLDIIDNPGSDCLLTWTTQESLYGPEEAALISSCYIHLLSTFVQDSQSPLHKIDVYPPEARNTAFEYGQGLIRESSWPVTVSHRIEDMINSYPHDIALKNGHGDALTYSALGKRVQSISNILISSGITEGQPVAVHQEPNFDFICSMLAILQIGAIYTPLQPDIPLPRLIRMALKTGIVAVLAHEWTLPTAQDLCAELPNNVSLINVSSILEVTEVITIRARPDFKAIILHTSGTTGDPKGVILSHSNIRNEAEHSANSYGIQREVVLQQSSPGFDMSLTQIFSALAFGGTLVVIPVSARKDPVAIARIIETENITFTAATPSEYSTWLENGRIHGLQKSSWKIAISGGEKVSKHLMAQFRKLEKFDLRLFNAYGPTESTCSATRMQLSLDESNAETIAAGYPAPNTSIYVLDEQLRPVPCGVIGEIYLGGSGVAIGYTDEAASRSSFVADPFADEGAETGSARVYRTGDIGRWSRAGTLLVDGRSSGDSQVKLRGLRIELQEVEEAIMNQGRGAVKRVVVTLRSYKTSLPETLIAHVVLSSDLSEKDIFETVHCIRTNLPLPQYMHPTIVIPMDFLPTQTSGKVDRQAVSTMPLPLMNEELDSNLSTSEKKLASLWYTLVPGIPTEQLTTNTDFFEAGGNSMLLIRLQANIYEVFDIKVALVHLFERSTLGSMSSLLEDSPGYTEKIYDWEIESSWTPAYRLNRDIVMQPILTSDKRVIVLTGASGFLGQGLLQRLLTDPSIATIHCIAVRNPETLSHLIQDSKLVIHKGDLRQPDLGLPTDSVVSIFEHAEAVIHNGADVSHMKSYAALKAANLDSTKELFKLCIARHVPFHFISTAGVALLSGLEEFDEISAAPYKPPADSSDGYTVTKWCSERFLEKASEEFDVPTYIHRPSSILREDEPGLDILQNMLKYIDITRASPSSNSLQGYFDVVYLDTVVNGVVQSLEGAPGQLLDYKHHSGDILVPFEELGTFCEQRFGALESLSMDKWIAKAEQAGLNGLVAAALRRMLDGEVTVRFPKLVKSN